MKQWIIQICVDDARFMKLVWDKSPITDEWNKFRTDCISIKLFSCGFAIDFPQSIVLESDWCASRDSDT